LNFLKNSLKKLEALEFDEILLTRFPAKKDEKFEFYLKMEFELILL
jgi:hypothetical protein